DARAGGAPRAPARLMLSGQTQTRRQPRVAALSTKKERAVGYFSSPEEVDTYIGEMFRQAANHAEVGPKMKAAQITLRIIYQDPDCELNSRLHDPMEVRLGP